MASSLPPPSSLANRPHGVTPGFANLTTQAWAPAWMDSTIRGKTAPHRSRDGVARDGLLQRSRRSRAQGAARGILLALIWIATSAITPLAVGAESLLGPGTPRHVTYPSAPPPNCMIVAVDLTVKTWISYSGPLVADGIPFDFLDCPLGRSIHHVMFCAELTLQCVTPDNPGTFVTTQVDCFHAGGSNGNPIMPLPNEPPPNKHLIDLDTPLLPDLVSPAQYEQFLEWYLEAWATPGYFGQYCSMTSRECNSMNCGTYFLILLGKLLKLSPPEIDAMMPELPPCHHYAYELYPHFLPAFEVPEDGLAMPNEVEFGGMKEIFKPLFTAPELCFE